MLIKQTDYQRIYRVINSLLLAQNADPASASMYSALSARSSCSGTTR